MQPLRERVFRDHVCDQLDDRPERNLGLANHLKAIQVEKRQACSPRRSLVSIYEAVSRGEAEDVGRSQFVQPNVAAVHLLVARPLYGGFDRSIVAGSVKAAPFRQNPCVGVINRPSI